MPYSDQITGTEGVGEERTPILDPAKSPGGVPLHPRGAADRVPDLWIQLAPNAVRREIA
jgi:hypothetical protein